MTALLRAALAGAATGDRSMTGVAALALTAPSQAATQPDRLLSIRWVKGLTVLLAAQELVIDKLPRTPSRLEPQGLGARCVAAAAAGVIIARRDPDVAASETAPRTPGDAEPVRSPSPMAASTVACAVVATVVAVGSAWLGARWRSWAVAHTGHDYMGAVGEDAVALSLAWLCARATTPLASS